MSDACQLKMTTMFKIKENSLLYININEPFPKYICMDFQQLSTVESPQEYTRALNHRYSLPTRKQLGAVSEIFGCSTILQPSFVDCKNVPCCRRNDLYMAYKKANCPV